MKLEKYKLKASIRKQFDNLSDEDKVLFGFENYSSDLLVLGKIFTYYGLENHPVLKTLALDIKKAELAYNYARNVIKGRWLEVEDIIKTDAGASYQYARDIIKGRWPEGEDIIKNNARLACSYACYVIEGRWIEGEDIIKTNKNLWNDYQEEFIT